MPMYMDLHKTGEATAEDLAKAHLKDLEIQSKYDVKYVTYWFDEREGRAFCFVEAPSKEAAEVVHRESHGLVANEIIEVFSSVTDFLGNIAATPAAKDPSRTDTGSAAPYDPVHGYGGFHGYYTAPG